MLFQCLSSNRSIRRFAQVPSNTLPKYSVRSNCTQREYIKKLNITSKGKWDLAVTSFSHHGFLDYSLLQKSDSDEPNLKYHLPGDFSDPLRKQCRFQGRYSEVGRRKGRMQTWWMSLLEVMHYAQGVLPSTPFGSPWRRFQGAKHCLVEGRRLGKKSF